MIYSWPIAPPALRSLGTSGAIRVCLQRGAPRCTVTFHPFASAFLGSRNMRAVKIWGAWARLVGVMPNWATNPEGNRCELAAAMS